jgi:hypothetical protein
MLGPAHRPATWTAASRRGDEVHRHARSAGVPRQALGVDADAGAEPNDDPVRMRAALGGDPPWLDEAVPGTSRGDAASVWLSSISLHDEIADRLIRLRTLGDHGLGGV